MNHNVLDDDSYVRRLLSFVCFASTAFPDLSKKGVYPWNFETVRTSFADWVNKRDRTIINNSKELDNVTPGSEDFVWYRIHKNKYANVALLYSIIGFYKCKTVKAGNGGAVDSKKRVKRDKHADLIIEILKGVSEGTYPPQTILDEINLTYYWDKQVMGFYAKVLQLKDMTDAQFRALPDHEKWLNE